MKAVSGLSVVSPTLIGREEQMALLTGLATLAGQGQSRLALIAGEAGVGKSRLIGEIKTYAKEHGFGVVQGRCFEQDRNFPYAPAVDLLRSFCPGRSAAELARIFGAISSELIKLLPELAPIFPHLTPAPPAEPEQEKRRLFQALTQFILQQAAGTDAQSAQPLLAVFEDVHWADDASLEWFLYLARRLGNQPILLLLTYRHDENHPGLTTLLAALDRIPFVSELLLSPLTRADTDAMLRAIFHLDHSPRADFFEALYTLTEGNPFFIEEVLKSLIAAGDIYQVSGEWTRKPMSDLRIPRSVQVAVEQRTQRLSRAAQRLLILAAAAGQRFNFDVLQAMTQQSEDELLQQVKELIAAQLVVEESDETFAFRHALTRQAIYSALLGRERKALHRGLAEALERCYADSLHLHASELAHHNHEAGLWPQALKWSQRAGEQAERLYAYGEALRHYRRALHCADQLGDSEQAATIERAIGRVHDERGENDLASQAYRRGLQLTNDPAQRSALKVDLGAAYVNLADERGVVYLQQALDELDVATQGKQAVMAMLWLARHYHLCAQYTRALAYLEQAHALIEPLADTSLLRLFYGSMAIVLMYSARFEESMTWAQRGVQLGEEHQDARAVVLGYLYLAENSEYLGRWRDTQEFASRGRQAARQAGWHSMEVWTDLERLVVDYYRGDLDAGSQLARDCLAVAQDLHERRALLHTQKLLVLIESARGREEAAYTLGEVAVREVDEVVGVGIRCWIRLALAGLHMQRAEWEQAAGLYEQCMALLAGGENRVIQMELGAPMAEAYLALGRVEAAAALIADTLALAEAAGALHYAAVAQRVHGQICAAQGRFDDALAACDKAIAGCIALGSRLELAHACYQRGAVQQARGELAAAQADWTEASSLCGQMSAQALRWRVHGALGRLAQARKQAVEAEREFAAARAIVTELLAAMRDESCRRNLRERAAALIPAAAPARPHKAAMRELGGLTLREREVAALIAQGKSNREIAAALVVSERTVTTHISNIFSKLGYTTRAQVAAWVVANGLQPPTLN